MTYQYQIKRLCKWCLIFQSGEEEEAGSLIQNILIRRSSVWTDGSPGLHAGGSRAALPSKGRKGGRFMEINRVVCRNSSVELPRNITLMMH